MQLGFLQVSWPGACCMRLAPDLLAEITHVKQNVPQGAVENEGDTTPP